MPIITAKVETGRWWFKASLGKLSETLSQNEPYVVDSLVIPATREVEVKKLWSKASPRQKLLTLSVKQTKAKRVRGMG
jgi:hypothetical protein